MVAAYMFYLLSAKMDVALSLNSYYVPIDISNFESLELSSIFLSLIATLL